MAYVPYLASEVAIVTAIDVDPNHGGGRIQSLNLTVPTLAKIFTHKISYWTHAEIAAENPNVDLRFPIDATIQTVVRIDSNNSTAALIALFLSNSDARVIWNAYATALKVPTDTVFDQWPNDPDTVDSRQVESGSKGVMDFITSAPKDAAPADRARRGGQPRTVDVGVGKGLSGHEPREDDLVEPVLARQVHDR